MVKTAKTAETKEKAEAVKMREEPGKVDSEKIDSWIDNAQVEAEVQVDKLQSQSEDCRASNSISIASHDRHLELQAWFQNRISYPFDDKVEVGQSEPQDLEVNKSNSADSISNEARHAQSEAESEDSIPSCGHRDVDLRERSSSCGSSDEPAMAESALDDEDGLPEEVQSQETSYRATEFQEDQPHDAPEDTKECSDRKLQERWEESGKSSSDSSKALVEVPAKAQWPRSVAVVAIVIASAFLLPVRFGLVTGSGEPRSTI